QKRVSSTAKTKTAGSVKNSAKSSVKSGAGSEKRKLNKGLVFLLAVVAAAAIASAHLPEIAETFSLTQKGVQSEVKHEQTYLNGVTIDGISVGGLDYEQAKMLIENSVNTELTGNALVVKSTDGSKIYNYTFDSFGIGFDIEGALKAAMQFGKVEEEYAADMKALESGRADFAVYSYSIPKITSCVRAIGAANSQEAKNASCVFTDGGFEITPEVIGYSVDTDAIYKQAIEHISKRQFNREISFEIETIQPSVTRADFAYIENELSSFSSQYKGGDENRIQNLRNACSKINGTIVYPNEIFSTNDAFNPCTEANGWANAGTIVGGKVEDSIGGGMCQVSSALYDAVLYAELEVVERHNHSLKVGYAQYAFDATLAGDYLDLKFRNNTGYPIYIESYLTSSSVVVKIYGYNRFSPTRRVELENKFIEDIPHGDYVIIEDPELPEGETKIEVEQLDGKKYELYKKVYENGELIDTVKVNTSTYKPRDGEKHVGTGAPQSGSDDDNDGGDDDDYDEEVHYDEDTD
ncbi:MAG: VanW family protein, partial [Firmicutes bacterium]|nr:VanW family protein [Bacillota bacterium]